MRVLVCGSRDFDDDECLYEVLNRINDSYNFHSKISCIIHGGARGADTLAQRWAEDFGVNSISVHPNWSLGKKAGPLRNIKMLKEHLPDQVIAFWDGKSPGTRHMIQIAEEANIPTEVVIIK